MLDRFKRDFACCQRSWSFIDSLEFISHLFSLLQRQNKTIRDYCKPAIEFCIFKQPQ